MRRVTGIGGIFIKARDVDAMKQWYARHLDIPLDGDSAYGAFKWRSHDDPDEEGTTVWSLFSDTSTYFDPSAAPFMVNYRVDDLDALLAKLAEEGVERVGEVEDYEYGRFAWIVDPEGNKIELWEPPAGPARQDG